MPHKTKDKPRPFYNERNSTVQIIDHPRIELRLQGFNGSQQNLMERVSKLAPEMRAFFTPEEFHHFAWKPVKVVCTEVKYITSCLKSSIPQDHMYHYDLQPVEISTAIRLLMMKPEILEQTPLFRRKGLILTRPRINHPRITFEFVNGILKLRLDDSGSSSIASSDFVIFQEQMFQPR